jgi:thymidylate synthase
MVHAFAAADERTAPCAGVAEELLWFISGCTDGNKLAEKGIKIWDGNGSREYLDSIGLTEREEGDLGPVYGFQWRHFGAQYVNRDTDYTGQGFDQLTDVIDKIKNNPTDRRIIMSAWNPAGAAPPRVIPDCRPSEGASKKYKPATDKPCVLFVFSAPSLG